MNVNLLLEMAASAVGDRVAIGSASAGDGLTYAELFERARAVATRLGESDAGYMILCDESSPAVPIAFFGAAWAGVPYTPLNYRLAPEALTELGRRVAPGLAVCADDVGALLGAVEGIEARSRTSFLAASAGAGVGDAADPGEWGMDPDDVAVLLFTSGTTGTPKAAVLRHRHLTSYILGSVEFMGAGDDEATLVSVPPYHVAGVAAMLSAVYAGRRIVQLPRFEAAAWIDAVRREGITHAMVVPTMLARIVEQLDIDGGEPLRGLRSLSYGGGRMPLPVVERALELFPDTAFVNAYGLTETSSTVAVLGPDDHREALASDDPAVRARLGSVGRPLPTVEVSVRDPSGSELPPGGVGEVFIRGEQVSGEYLGLGSLLDAEGWFPTRDGGYVDAEGYLFIQGRNDDVIVRGGENMSPGEIEEVVIRHPGVREVAAIGIPSTEWGESVALVVVADDPAPTADELCELIRAQLRSSRVPERVEFVDELPYNETGKLLRRVLRTSFADLGDDTPIA